VILQSLHLCQHGPVAHPHLHPRQSQRLLLPLPLCLPRRCLQWVAKAGCNWARRSGECARILLCHRTSTWARWAPALQHQSAHVECQQIKESWPQPPLFSTPFHLKRTSSTAGLSHACIFRLPGRVGVSTPRIRLLTDLATKPLIAGVDIQAGIWQTRPRGQGPCKAAGQVGLAFSCKACTS
jgi:hypothetical protein